MYVMQATSNRYDTYVLVLCIGASLQRMRCANVTNVLKMQKKQSTRQEMQKKSITELCTYLIQKNIQRSVAY
ncbi:hypothetical protein HMPREF3190_01624 [Umbribacter vaginalis]|nr:hypothetical protein HMPREF3190_01624 [Coriobacteriales bacterium DNF00809]